MIQSYVGIEDIGAQGDKGAVDFDSCNVNHVHIR